VTHVRLQLWLQQMQEAVAQALEYVEGMDRQAFIAERRTQQAVVLNLLLIGELAAKVLEHDSGFAGLHPEVPWSSMKGMRNRIAHGYFEMDLDIVWTTVAEALPGLKAALPAVLEAAQQGAA